MQGFETGTPVALVREKATGTEPDDLDENIKE